MSEILSQLENTFGKKGLVFDATLPKKPFVVVPSSQLIVVAEFLKENLGFDHVVSISVLDKIENDKFAVNYHLSSVANPKVRGVILTLQVLIDRTAPQIPSLVQIFPSVEWHEREEWEMFGVEFLGHPKLERLLLPESWNNGFPLRKDFQKKRVKKYV